MIVPPKMTLNKCQALSAKESKELSKARRHFQERWRRALMMLPPKMTSKRWQAMSKKKSKELSKAWRHFQERWRKALMMLPAKMTSKRWQALSKKTSRSSLLTQDKKLKETWKQRSRKLAPPTRISKGLSKRTRSTSNDCQKMHQKYQQLLPKNSVTEEEKVLKNPVPEEEEGRSCRIEFDSQFAITQW